MLAARDVLYQIGGRGHFCSRDEDDSHSSRSAIVETCYTQTSRLYRLKINVKNLSVYNTV